jgi:hypothetical protein
VTLASIREDYPRQKAKRHDRPDHRWTGIAGKKVFVVTSTTGNDVADVWAHASIRWRDCVVIKRVRL